MLDKTNCEQLQKDVEELQTRLAFQEDTLQQLDQTIADQDKTIRSLIAQLLRWEQRLEEISDTVAESGQPDSQPPPHY
ncbi:SlyX family protein [Eionea flava]